MDRSNVISFILRPLWAFAGQPFGEDWGIVKAAGDLYLAGVYFGPPTMAEQPLPEKNVNGAGVGGSWQAFQFGQIIYWNDGGVEHMGGVPVTKGATK